ncbi:MAG: CBS domain-containing protein [Hyphomicrobiaceae bacterium]
MNVAAILKAKGRSVVTARPEARLEDVARKLTEKNIGSVVIVGSNGTISGIVSERDIIRAVAERGAACLSEPASQAMTRNVQFCEADDTLEELMSTMTAGRFRHLPVIEDQSLAGIVSIGDIVKHHIAEVELEASALRSYIVAG